jgi:hypothetical protein
MRERAEQILRIACLILAALVLYQLAGIALRINPFHGVSVPALPALAAATNSPPGGGRGTNLVVSRPVAVKGRRLLPEQIPLHRQCRLRQKQIPPRTMNSQKRKPIWSRISKQK